MKIYIARIDDGKYINTVGVFSSMIKAEKAIEQFRKKYKYSSDIESIIDVAKMDEIF